MKKNLLCFLAVLIFGLLLLFCALGGHYFGPVAIPFSFIFSFVVGRFIITPIIFEALRG